MHKCNQCGSEWEGRHWVAMPVQCPRCHRTDWNQPKKNKVRGEARNGSSVPVRHLTDGGITQRGRAQTAVQIGQREEDSKAVQIRPTPPKPEDIPGVTRGFPEPIEDEDVPEPEMCPYTEYDPESGETYMCGLVMHGPKVKHTRGRKAK